MGRGWGGGSTPMWNPHPNPSPPGKGFSGQSWGNSQETASAASLASLSARSFSGWPSCPFTQTHSIWCGRTAASSAAPMRVITKSKRQNSASSATEVAWPDRLTERFFKEFNPINVAWQCCFSFLIA